MTISWFRKAAGTALLAAISCSAMAQKADFNEVGRQMAIMLQNSHFARLPFNEELSKRFLTDYLGDLDSQKLYFTQEDVNWLNAKYGDKLHTLLLQGNCMPVATEIYLLFKKRVQARVAQTQELLDGPDFDFSADESVMMSRKDSAWPRNEKEATALWRMQIREAVLAETLRREMLTKLAKEQGKPDPVSGDRSPKQKIALRYKRFLSTVEDVDDEEIANYFMSSVARSYDPHTDYMIFREMSQFEDRMTNALVGVGALLQAEEDGATKILGIVVGGPADREGSLKLNDRVVSVNSLNTGKPEDMVDIMFMKIDKVVELIRGKEGTSVALKVEPASGPPGETKLIVIKRDKVELKDEQASGEVIEMKTEKGLLRRLGVITLPSFYADFAEGKVRCSVDVEKILNRLVEEKIEGLILDLRNNGGGALEEVCRMAGFFTGPAPVVQVKNTLGQTQVMDSDRNKPIYTGPMVVMTDKSSASASEILAGALQDLNRAVIVGGSSTFGKGTVQQTMDIGKMLPLFAVRNHAGVLKVTTRKFYRPSGSSTQMKGVVSDVAMPNLLDALDVGEEFLDHALPHDRIRPAAGFAPREQQALFIPKLKELSHERVNANNDFAYVIQDVIQAKARIKANSVSLNKAKREKELAESDAQQKERNSERRARFEEIAKQDKESFKFYKITLDDLEKGSDLRPYDPTSENGDYMRRAKGESEDLDESPKWPSGLDPVKRESLAVLCDLVYMTENTKMAGVIK